jgi:hypothetical protein
LIIPARSQIESRAEIEKTVAEKLPPDALSWLKGVCEARYFAAQ